jgi:hypothetical protein
MPVKERKLSEKKIVLNCKNKINCIRLDKTFLSMLFSLNC